MPTRVIGATGLRESCAAHGLQSQCDRVVYELLQLKVYLLLGLDCVLDGTAEACCAVESSCRPASKESQP